MVQGVGRLAQRKTPPNWIRRRSRIARGSLPPSAFRSRFPVHMDARNRVPSPVFP
nr:MAG TPA: hypothetical protein [Caudoviricetes sp.]